VGTKEGGTKEKRTQWVIYLGDAFGDKHIKSKMQEPFLSA